MTLWTDDPCLAARADAAGVDRVGLDLETIGKRERQAGLGTWISQHRIEQLPAIAASLAKAHLFARVNPLWHGTEPEVERLLEHGVEVLMLPMFETVEAVETFAALVGERATIVLLLERAIAAEQIDRIVRVPGVSEVHIGLNDMALSLKVKNRFEVLDCGLTENVSAVVRAAGLRFGVGGIGLVDDRSLPIPSDLIYAQYPRLGASSALLSRAFMRGEQDLQAEVARARERIAGWWVASASELQQARLALRSRLAECAAW